MKPLTSDEMKNWAFATVVRAAPQPHDLERLIPLAIAALLQYQAYQQANRGEL